MLESSPWTTMSIASVGAPTMPNGGKKEKVVSFNVERATNDISDIPGAQPGLKSYRYTNKPLVSLADVDPRNRPKVLAYERQGALDLTLCIDDIPGTRYAIKDRFLQSKRHVNPLCPEYTLPVYAETVPPQAPFVRDAMDVSDIEGTKPKIPKMYKTRDTFGVDDIEGTKPGWKPQMHKQKPVVERDISNVEDICKRTHRYTDRTTRVSNSLDPEYLLNSSIISDDKKSTRPKQPKAEIKDSHLLKTSDIEGATSAWKFRNRTEIRNINFTADIQGAQADTIPKGIKTERVGCPLDPFYKSLDNGAPIPPLNAPLVPKELVKFSALAPAAHVSHNEVAQLGFNNSNNNNNIIGSNNNNNNIISTSVSYAQRIESEKQDKDKLFKNSNQNFITPLDLSQLKGDLPFVSLTNSSNENINSTNNNIDNNYRYDEKPLSSSGSRSRLNSQFIHPVILNTGANSNSNNSAQLEKPGITKKVHIPVSPMASARSATNTPRQVAIKPSSIVTPREKKASQLLKADIDAVRQLT